MGVTSSKPQNIQIVLIAKKPTVGFKHTGRLTVTATKGETIGDLLERFNAFRGPNSQISGLYDMTGTPVDPTRNIDIPMELFIDK